MKTPAPLAFAASLFALASACTPSTDSPARGPAGPQGEQGPAGERGEQGPAGPQGEPGESASSAGLAWLDATGAYVAPPTFDPSGPVFTDPDSKRHWRIDVESAELEPLRANLERFYVAANCAGDAFVTLAVHETGTVRNVEGVRSRSAETDAPLITAVSKDEGQGTACENAGSIPARMVPLALLDVVDAPAVGFAGPLRQEVR